MIFKRLPFCSLFFFIGGGFDLNVKLKKILSCFLIMLLLFNALFSCVVYADEHGGSSGDLDVTPSITIPPSPPDPAEFLIRMILPDGGEAIDYVSDWLEKRWKTDDDRQKDYSVSDDGSTVHLHKQFVDELNQAVQDKVHALDGYYLFEPANSNKSALVPKIKANFIKYYSDESIKSYVQSSTFDTDLAYKFENYACVVFNPVYILENNFDWCFPYFVRKSSSGFDTSLFLYLSGGYLMQYNKNTDKSDKTELLKYKIDELDGKLYSYTGYSDKFVLDLIKSSMPYAYGSPFRIFYSLQDVKNYLNKGRIYAPQLPSTTISIPIKYINNSVSLPDITYNINTTNKTEVEIQNEYNTTLNNYLNDLNKFSDGGSGNNPTPTPSGGGSGDFGDGSTPTPTPPLGDGGSDQDGNGSDGWLKKIYDQLVKLSDSVSQHFDKEETFEDKLSKYLESHDKKLDAVIDAIDKLSQGKEEGEEKGCKYDYTELSDFMTKLWNDSDQKFDQMVELLKENNEYQEKMLSTLNSIKNILLAQTVMDAFKNRSSETANKAKEKFPTSVPWDVGLLVNAMDAEPKAPVFELPIKIERLNINEKITVDISSGEWEKLAKACRYMLSLLFVLFMVNLTRKLFFSKGDD